MTTAYVCPHCYGEARIYNGKIGDHFKPDPIKTWVNRVGVETGRLIDVYPRCEWSGAKVVFP